MLIQGDKLKTLISDNDIAPISCYDETCIKVRLGKTIVQIVPQDDISIITYGERIPDCCIKKIDITESGLVLSPFSAVLAMSEEFIRMPIGAFGLLQTTGSLARMMVSVHFSDGQIDPGFHGHITFEMFNASPFSVSIPYRSLVGNIYLFKTAGKVKAYSGKYAMADEPTLPFENYHAKIK